MPFHMRVFVEFERAIISERVRAGLERVGQNGL
jgi:DNA invertase Pin-like site-specific DNA recombinase